MEKISYVENSNDLDATLAKHLAAQEELEFLKSHDKVSFQKKKKLKK
jgi:hypothetical protein